MVGGRQGRPVVLVAEPQALPGMWLEDVLADAGCAVSGPYGTSDEATESLDGTPPDFAVVSVNLNRGPGFPLACALRRRGIPFALISGDAQVPKAFADVPLFDRLFDARDMVSAVTAGCAVPGCPHTCPMLGRIAAGEPFALDQCPTACRT
ncbi:histidine kinase [Methylobacterium radiotolerans]|nr:histidine kinase [Methylobacterium radiotolerans]